MSAGNLSLKGYGRVRTLGAADDIPLSDAWVRPADWLPLETPAAGTHKITGLVAVYDDASNYISVTVDMSAGGTYEVDWGDGTVETFADNARADHTYAYDDLDASTYCSRGYRQAIVSITQKMGTFAGVTFQSRWGGYTAEIPDGHSYKWLEIKINSSNLSTITFTQGAAIRMHYLESVYVGENAATYWASQFYWCVGLKHVDISVNQTVILNMGYCFDLCNGLRHIVLSDLYSSSSVSIGGMFSSCYSLESAAIVGDTSKITDIGSICRYCYALKRFYMAPNTTLTSMNYAFESCYSLRDPPEIATQAVTDMSYAFQNCYALRAVGPWDIGACTTIYRAFYNCFSLEKVRFTNVSALVSCYSAFAYCRSLRSVRFDTELADNASTSTEYMFQMCTAMARGPDILTKNARTTSNMFRDCTALQEVPAYDMTNSVINSDMFYGCRSIQTIPHLVFNGGSYSNRMFQGCIALQTVEVTFQNTFNGGDLFYDCWGLKSIIVNGASYCSTWAGAFTGTPSLSSLRLHGTQVGSIDLRNHPMSVSDVNAFLDSLGCALAGTQDIYLHQTVADLGGVPNRAVTTTADSETVACTNTTGITAGMWVNATNITSSVAVTFCSRVGSPTPAVGSPAAYGSPNENCVICDVFAGVAEGTAVAFPTLVTASSPSEAESIGLHTDSIYYAVNCSGRAFQLAREPGGSAIDILAPGTGTMVYTAQVVTVNTNVSVVLTNKANASGAVNADFSWIERWRGEHKGFTTSIT